MAEGGLIPRQTLFPIPVSGQNDNEKVAPSCLFPCVGSANPGNERSKGNAQSLPSYIFYPSISSRQGDQYNI